MLKRIAAWRAFRRGLRLMDGRRNDEALSALRYAVMLRPKSARYRLELLETLYHVGRMMQLEKKDQAASAYFQQVLNHGQEMLSVEPSCLKALELTAKACTKLGRLAEGAEVCDAFLRRDAQNPIACKFRAHFAFKQRDDASVLVYGHVALKQVPTDDDTRGLVLLSLMRQRAIRSIHDLPPGGVLEYLNNLYAGSS